MKSFAVAFPHCQLWWNGVEPLMVGRLEKVEHQGAGGRLQSLRDVPLFTDELARVSGGASLHELQSFWAALLLVDEDFRSVAEQGKIYDLDRPGLEFCGKETLNYHNLAEIFQRASPSGAVRDVAEKGMFSPSLPVLYWKKEFELRRRRLMNISIRMAGIFH